jgi:hypothetical protein
LVTDGFMREGDQQLVAHYPANKRPIVYDLSMSEQQRREWALVADDPEVNPLRAKAAAIGKTGAEASAKAAEARKAQVSGGVKMTPQEIPSTPPVGGVKMTPQAGGVIQNDAEALGVSSGTRGGVTGDTQTVREPPATTNPPSPTAPPASDGQPQPATTASSDDDASTEKSKRGTRIPEDFATTKHITPELVEWARTECPDVDARWATASFVDHFSAAPGQRGVKLDWVKTWKNWMRREQEKMWVARRRTTGGRGPAYSDERTWGPRPGAQGHPAEPEATEEELRREYGLLDADESGEQTGGASA